MTLREYSDANPGRILDGLVVTVPPEHRTAGMHAKMAIKSGWGMPPDGCGLWLIEPGQQNGRVFPVFLKRDEFYALKVAAGGGL